MGDTGELTFRVGSRKSELALIQTNFVIERLAEIHGGKYTFTLSTMDTIGDKILDKPLPKIGEKSLFTQELEQALEDRVVDFVVHSLKDLPTTLPPGKVIGAVLKRLDPRDCVIVHEKHKNLTLATLPHGSVIGTSSLRRTAQLSFKYPHLKIESIRGNMNTRLKKLSDGQFDAIVVAVAGIQRLNWSEKINEVLDCESILYAVGQGALAVECMGDNEEVLSLLTPLMDRDTVLSITAERSFLRQLGGGCSAPAGVNCVLSANVLHLSGLASSLDGSQAIRETAEVVLNAQNEIETREELNGAGDQILRNKPSTYCGVVISSNLIKPADMASAEKLGEDVAKNMIARGASVIMEEARKIVTSNISK